MFSILRLYGSATRTICFCEKGENVPPPWESAVLLAELEVDNVCTDVDTSRPGWEEKLLNCIIGSLPELVKELEPDEVERLRMYRFLYVWPEIEGLNHPLGKRAVQNPFYYKALYEKCRAEKEALEAKLKAGGAVAEADSSSKLKELADELKKCTEQRASCEIEKAKLEGKLESLQNALDRIEKLYKQCDEERSELSRLLLTVYRELEEMKAELKNGGQNSGSTSSYIEQILQKLSDLTPVLAERGLDIAKEYVKGRVEAEKIKATAETLQKIEEIRYKREKQKHESMMATYIIGTISSFGKKLGLFEEEPVQMPVQTFSTPVQTEQTSVQHQVKPSSNSPVKPKVVKKVEL